jgi:hypothetical protein
MNGGSDEGGSDEGGSDEGGSDEGMGGVEVDLIVCLCVCVLGPVQG